MPATVARSILSASAFGLGAKVTFEAPEGASQTFKKGAPLKFSSGLLIEISADDVAGIVGVAAEDGKNKASGAKVRFYPALPHYVFEATLEDETNNNHALVAGNMGAAFALQKDATNNRWFLDENDSTNHATRVIGFKDPLGTVKARVFFVFAADTTLYGT